MSRGWKKGPELVMWIDWPEGWRHGRQCDSVVRTWPNSRAEDCVRFVRLALIFGMTFRVSGAVARLLLEEGGPKRRGRL